MAGEWSSDDLTALLQEVLRNGSRLRLDSHTSLVARLLNASRHRLRANTMTGSQRNIQAHYDLGNEFFRLFLDKSLTKFNYRPLFMCGRINLDNYLDEN